MAKQTAFLVALVGSLFLWAGVARAVTIPLGVTTTLTSLDFQATTFDRDPAHSGFPIPAQRLATTIGNTARVALTAAPGEAGVAKASLGIEVDWDLGEQSWEEVQDLPIEVTLNFSYTLVANWSAPNGSANAGIGVRPFSGGWHDFLGFETGESGMRSEQLNLSFTTTPAQVGGRIFVESYAQAHTSPGRIANAGQAAVTLNSITIVFAPTPPDLRVTAIEVTQAVQDLNHSVQLVAGKRTFVRLHVQDSAFNRAHSTYAQLRIEREGLGQWLTPLNPGYQVAVRGLPNRAALHHAFLFELPSSYTQAGDLSIRAELNPVTPWRDRSPPESDYANNTQTVQVRFEPTRPLNLVVYRVAYIAAGSQWQAASREVDQLVSWLRRAYPIPRVQLWRRDFLHGAGLPDGTAVNTQLLAKKRWDGVFDRPGQDGRPPASAHFYGLVQDGGGFMRGLAVAIPGSVAAGPTGNPAARFPWDSDGSYGDWYGGHELGHTYGRRHPGHCDQERDTDHPAGDYAFGRISPTAVGNGAIFGFDSLNKTIYGPTWRDGMTYCAWQWISGFTHEGLMRYFEQTPVAATEQERRTGEHLLVSGVIDPQTNTGRLAPAFILPAGAGSLTTPGPYKLVLRNSLGAILAEYPFTPLLAESGPPDPTQPAADELAWLLVDELVPYVAGTELVALENATGPIVTLASGPAAPTVTLITPNGGEMLTGDSITVTWTAGDLDGDPLAFNLQYSPDDGASWEMLAQSLLTNTVMISSSNLIAGEAARFRVWASDGLHTASDTMDAPFSVPNHPPIATILAPATTTVVLSETVGLVAAVEDVDAGALADSQIEWHSDLDGLLGNGPQLSTALLSTGAHTITLRVADGGGAVVTQTLVIHVLADPTLAPNPADALVAAPAPLLLEPTQGITQTLVAVDNQNPLRTLPWQASTSQPWLELQPANGVTPGDLLVSYRDVGLTGGSYTATVTINSPVLADEVTTVLVQLLLPSAPTVPETNLFLPVVLR